MPLPHSHTHTHTHARARAAVSLLSYQEPSNVKALVRRGHCRAQRDQHADAIADFQRALSLHPNHKEATRYLKESQEALAKTGSVGRAEGCSVAARGARPDRHPLPRSPGAPVTCEPSDRVAPARSRRRLVIEEDSEEEEEETKEDEAKKEVAREEAVGTAATTRAVEDQPAPPLPTQMVALKEEGATHFKAGQ